MVAAACRRAGRNPAAVRVIGVTKTVGPDALGPLLDAGVRDFGENRWQHARELMAEARAREAVWHFIGHLQSNKVRHVVQTFDWIHSLDSLALAQEVSRHADRLGKRMPCLIQVNVAGEVSKHGVPPEDVLALARAVSTLPGIQLRGLMTIAPKAEQPEAVRPVFAELRRLLEQVREDLGHPEISELSMGMSEDFPIAVEEGATLIRVGRLLMGTGE
ncbi:MAG: YggS family pyridoxal phosphate-dependent enzyme [Alicyclobacillus sp.]|nr:YggS family pyridoxal phosphate-dependent enzyme [Alicyclobacillus sp.]